MSPDAAFGGTLNRLVGRARLATAVEAAAIGAAVAAWSMPAGFVVAIGMAAVRARSASRAAVARRLERADPSLRNIVVTAEEILSGALTTRPEIRERVLGDANLAAVGAGTRAMWSISRIAVLLALAAGVWLVRAGFTPRVVTGVPADRRTDRRAAAGSPSDLQVTVSIDPPRYTGLPPVKFTDPTDLRVIENSQLEMSVVSAARRVDVDVNGASTPATRTRDGSFVDRATAKASGYVIVTADGARRLMPMTVIPDALPTVKLVSPGRDLVFAGGGPQLRFEILAVDDYGLRSIALRFTKISGSGEQFEFEDGEIPLSIERASQLSWKAGATRTLDQFGLREGDMLVYRAVATDGRPGAGEASSDAYFIEISRLGAAAGDAFTLPEEETRYALSQQMLIVKTERLIRQRGALAASDFAEAARELAIEQRMIRSELIFMLGGEIADEEVEAEQSTELQEGRLANRGQRDLRAATVAMSRAEKQLSDASPEKALEAERAAVAALQRAFARDRYILRALATRNPLDETRRLTGKTPNSIGWRRQLLANDANRQALRMSDLIDGIGQASAESSSDADTRNRLLMLAELSLRADPSSAAMRQAAADLQVLANAWAGLSAADRSRQLDIIASAVAGEARRALADPPVPVGDRR